jgi:tRNA nucleotidyltransferase (CCA-adding enzyme)
MDGVLADFFAEWAKLAGVKSGSYRDIPPAKIDPTLNMMIDTDFFARLPKFPTTDKLIKLVIEQFGKYSILSSPLRNDHENSKKHKLFWIKKNLNPQPVNSIIIANKQGHAVTNGVPNILIDDRGLNIENWNKAGGHGIKYQADEDSLSVVVNGLQEYKEKYLAERGVMSISGLTYGGFRRPLKIKKSTPGKLSYPKVKMEKSKVKMGHSGSNMHYKHKVRKVYEDVTSNDLDQIETYADRLFAKVGVDVNFTKHFIDRANDTRNKRPITPAELTRLFKQEYKQWAKPIAQMGPDAEAVMTDMRTDVNVPFALVWDKNNNELDLIAKTVMRKQDFKTSNRTFTIEDHGVVFKRVDGTSLNENEDLDTKAFNEILNPALEKLDSVFKKNKFEIRIVGGAVRDIALGKSPKDIDLATDATPDEMIAMLDKANIKHKPTGLEHGTLTAIIDSEGYEITTLRADVSTDGRHADVEFIRNWKEDAQRRDLTYNAMSLDFDGNLYDYFNGMDDLQDKVSKFVGDPIERIKEDYLRILRYFRFQSKLDSPSWDQETLNAIKDNAKGLAQVSVERIWQEMAKLLVGHSVIQTLSYMSATSVDEVIGLNTSKIQMLNDLKGNTDPVIALAILVDDSSVAKKWRLSNAEAQDLDFYLSYRNKKLNKEQAEHLIIDGKDKTKVSNLAKIQNQTELANYIEKFNIPEFPITGNDLIQRGITPGPGLGNTLNKLKDTWKKSNYKLSADELLNAIATESKSFAIKRMESMIFDEGVGIITPYNTTKDVKPGETLRQANKLGLQLKTNGKGEGMPGLLMRSWKNEKRGSNK